MQSVAVLLLELSYSGQGMKKENSSVIPSISKLIRWLKAMQDNNPVAARAYGVVREILGSSAPVFQIKVNELLTLERDDISHAQMPHYSQKSLAKQPLKQWKETSLSHGLVANMRSSGPDPSHQWLHNPIPRNQPHTDQHFSKNWDPNPVVFENLAPVSFEQGLLFIYM
jgi:hypothetical protein